MEDEGPGGGVKTLRQARQGVPLQVGLGELPGVQFGPDGGVEDLPQQKRPVLGVPDIQAVQKVLGVIAQQHVAHIKYQRVKHLVSLLSVKSRIPDASAKYKSICGCFWIYLSNARLYALRLIAPEEDYCRAGGGEVRLDIEPVLFL